MEIKIYIYINYDSNMQYDTYSCLILFYFHFNSVIIYQEELYGKTWKKNCNIFNYLIGLTCFIFCFYNDFDKT